MNKGILTLIAFLCLCVSAYADHVSADRAMDIANRMIGGKTAGKTVKRVAPRTALGTRASEDANYYIFTGADNKGFVIVSADDAVRPVLGYSPDSKIDPDNLPVNMKEYLEWANKQIAEVKAKGLKADVTVAKMWKAPENITPVVLLETANWGQRYPYNADCPMLNGEQTLTGCVATAIAIMMRYYSYPEHGYSTTEAYTGSKGVSVAARNLETHRYDWANMPLDHQEENTSMAELMADIGAAVQASYGSTATSAGVRTDALSKHFRYVFDSQSYSSDAYDVKLREALDRKRPTICSGEGLSGQAGHAFIVDGYSSDGMFHINWGWSGSSNGYFYLNGLSDVGYSFDDQDSKIDFVPETMADIVANVECNGRYFSRLRDAFISAEKGEPTIVNVLKDFDDSANGNCYVYDKTNVTIDLNGFTVVIPPITTYGKLHIIDSQGKSELVCESDYCHLSVWKEGEMVMDGIKYRSIGNDTWHALNVYGGKATLNDCYIDSQTIYTISNEYGGETTLNNCDIIHQNKCSWEGGAYTIMNDNSTTKIVNCRIKANNNSQSSIIYSTTKIEIYDSEFKAEGSGKGIVIPPFSPYNAQVDIHGGTFLSKSDSPLMVLQKCNLNVYSGNFSSAGGPLLEGNDNSKISIMDGSFKGKLCNLDETSSLTASGGIYSQDPSAYVANGYSVSENSNSATKADYPFMISNPDQCASPAISYANGKIHFDCSTEGATVHYAITPSEATSSSTTNADVSFDAAYTITAYATAEGYSQSKTCTFTIKCGETIEVEKIVEVPIEVEKIVEVHDTIYVYDGSATSIELPTGETITLTVIKGIIHIKGAPIGSSIYVYSLAGEMYEFRKVREEDTILDLPRNEIYIIKVGDKTFKVKI